MRKLLSGAVLLLLLSPIPSVSFQGPQEARNQGDIDLTEGDRAAIVKLTLERALVEKKVPDYNIIEKQDAFLLSSENISAELVPRLEGIKLLLLEPDQIKGMAAGRGDYVYYFRFKEFKVEGGKVTVAFDNIPMYAERPTSIAFGGGFIMEFRKQDGKWVGKETLRWVV